MSQIKTQKILICGVFAAREIGLNEAIVLEQLCYLQNKSGASEWICNAHKTWQRQFEYLSFRTTRRIFASLVKLELLEFKKGQRCKLYRLNYKAASRFLLDSNATGPNLDIKSSIVDEDTLREMLDIWQKKIPTSGQALTLTPKRRADLQILFGTVFDSKMEQWTNFVDKIARSEFLMGKTSNKFKVFLDWAITFEHCVNILEGTYANKDVKNQSLPEDILERVNASLESIQDKDWKETARLLVQILGVATYQGWFNKIHFKKHENNCVYLEAEMQFIRDWVDSHYVHKIKKAWNNATNKQINNVIIQTKMLKIC